VTASREGYTGRDYGTHHAQLAEQQEANGMDVVLGSAPYDLAVEWEQDLQDDLEAERLGDDRPYDMAAWSRPVNTTNLRMAA
jgi:hypothetical protein